MNNKLYNAAITQLRGKAMESLALMDMLLNNPTLVPDHSSLVEEITHHACRIAEYEGAMQALQTYGVPPRAPVAAPAPTPAAPSEGIPVADEEDLAKRSPTFRKARKRQAKASKKEEKE